jgi:hypothetical protein
LVFELGHIDAAAAEMHALGFEPEALFQGGVAPQLDLASSAQHAMPWQFESAMKGRHYLTRRARETGSTSHCSVSGDLSARD